MYLARPPVNRASKSRKNPGMKCTKIEENLKRLSVVMIFRPGYHAALFSGYFRSIELMFTMLQRKGF
jgi:hypothetical protein